MALLAVSVFATAGTIHYQTPMLGRIGAEFHAGPAAAGWVATLSFAGYLAGTLLLVPLGDRFDKRRLILGQMFGLVAALAAMGAAPSLPALAAAAFVVGVCASVSQHIVPLVTELAAPEARGRAVGTLLSGLFVGILFARVSAGVVADRVEWRWMYAIAAALVLAVAVVALARVPHAPAATRKTYGELLASLASLLRTRAQLRQASAIQFLLGICYGGFWATIAPMLALLHGMGPAAAGLIGIPGAAGVFVARPAGRWMDKAGVGPVVRAGILGVFGAFVALALAKASIVFVVIGAALLDCGLRAAMVANQTLVTSSIPEARSRSATIFAAHIWGGNSVGAFLATTALAHFGWLAVCAICAAATLAAFAIAVRRTAPSDRAPGR
jgi:predicted MFS family arabinose efflux permease